MKHLRKLPFAKDLNENADTTNHLRISVDASTNTVFFFFYVIFYGIRQKFLVQKQTQEHLALYFKESCVNFNFSSPTRASLKMYISRCWKESL